MNSRRVDRLNSLLREVISEVVRNDVKDRHVSELSTITHVSVDKDLRQAKVYVSVIVEPEKRQATIDALNTAAGFIAVRASKKVVLRFFPELTFYLDDSVDKQMRIDQLIHEMHQKETNE